MLFGQDGNDSINGAQGNDTLIGGSGDDSLLGESGNDMLMGGPGTNTLDGGTGDDDLFSVSATDSLDGSSASDVSEFNGVDVTFPTNVAASFFLPTTTLGGRHDQVRVLGAGRTVTLGSAPLSIDLGSFIPQSGDTFTIVELIDVTSSVSGTFNFNSVTLPQGGTFTSGLQQFQIDYAGGDGNDIVLTVVQSPDFGDAPDTGAGTGAGNYQTLAANRGPSHTIVAGLQLGANVDGDDGTLQNVTANADDVNGALTDDEDGVLNPLDLRGTIGAAPSVTLLATNTTGSTATLSGWIDYNNDGVFDNSIERAQIAVPDGTTDGRFTLTFPAIPSGFTGTTYARFRLSTDAAAQNSTGAATDGEVEDFTFSITAPSSGTVASFLKITHELNGGPTLGNANFFGVSVAPLGDLDGDGVTDLAVGSTGDDTGGMDRGAVYILLLNADGTVKSSTKIAHEANGGPTLSDVDYFGNSVTSLGDLDGDGVPDLAVGAFYDDTGGDNRGSVHILFLNSNGTVKNSTKIASDTNGGPALADDARFGRSLVSAGDLDGDGVTDLAVGADHSNTVYVLLLNTDGTVKSSTNITDQTNGGPTLAALDRFGSSVTSLGDLDGDGVADLAVGAFGDNGGGEAFANRGAVYVLFLNADATAKSSTKITHESNGGPTLVDGDRFGSSVTALGDLDGDGVNDAVVGAVGDDTGGDYRGAVHVLLLNADGTAKSSTKIAHQTSGGPAFANEDRFGFAAAAVGDLNGDGITELAVGAHLDDTGGPSRGAVHVVFLSALQPEPASINLPADGGNYEVLRDGGDLVLRVAGGSELFRQSVVSVSELAIAGSDGDDVVTTPGTGGAVATPILFTGGLGADQFDASLATGPTTLLGGSGNDTLTGGTNGDLIIGGSGSDVIAGGAGDDRIEGREGRDSLTGGAGNDTISGGSGQDTIEGGQNADVLLGGGGPDTISGGEDNDFIRGDGGRDFLDGDDGEDTLLGGPGADNIAGGLGNDTLNGVFRNDAFNQQVGPDLLFGGQRPAPRPAPAIPIEPDPEPEPPQFLSPPVLIDGEALDDLNSVEEQTAENIDVAFTGSLLPELLAL